MARKATTSDLNQVTYGRGENSTVVALLIEQYKAARLEEIVTKNVIRLLWFFLLIFSASQTTNAFSIGSKVISVRLSLAIELAGIFFAAYILYILSFLYQNRLNRESLRIREMLVSLDEKFKDYYVQELSKRAIYREKYEGMYFSKLIENEWWIWCFAVFLSASIKILPIIIFAEIRI